MNFHIGLGIHQSGFSRLGAACLSPDEVMLAVNRTHLWIPRSKKRFRRDKPRVSRELLAFLSKRLEARPAEAGEFVAETSPENPEGAAGRDAPYGYKGVTVH